MPHSLRAKIKGLRYKGIITDKDCVRLCKALDNEGVLDKIRAEIEGWQVDIHDNESDADEHDFVFERIFEIVDEYKGSEE